MWYYSELDHLPPKQPSLLLLCHHATRKRIYWCNSQCFVQGCHISQRQYSLDGKFIKSVSWSHDNSSLSGSCDWLRGWRYSYSCWFFCWARSRIISRKAQARSRIISVPVKDVRVRSSDSVVAPYSTAESAICWESIGSSCLFGKTTPFRILIIVRVSDNSSNTVEALAEEALVRGGIHKSHHISDPLVVPQLQSHWDLLWVLFPEVASQRIQQLALFYEFGLDLLRFFVLVVLLEVALPTNLDLQYCHCNQLC